MRKKFSVLAVKSFLGLLLLNQSVYALELNGVKVDFSNSSKTDKKLRVLNSEYKTIIVKFDLPLNREQKDNFHKSGVQNIVYAGDLSYYFYARSSILDSLDYSDSGFVAKTDMRSQYRMKEEGLNTLSMGTYQDFNVLFLAELSKSELITYFLNSGISATIIQTSPQLKAAKVRVFFEDVQKLKELPLIQYMDRCQSLVTVKGQKETRNLKTAQNMKASELWSGSYNLNGENMNIGVVDGGSVRATHQEFNDNEVGRIVNRSSVDTNFHATHVAGTIAADGDKSSARGMANRAKIYSYGFTDVAFADAVLKLYNSDGVLFSNHSYGYSDKIRLGEYDSEASTQDKAVSNNPFLNIFEAAGNDGKISGYADFGIIKGPGNSKNIFTIGALNVNSSGVAQLSSTGPVRDGRIKPDLSVRGEYVTSSTDEADDSYAMMSGTSMATPAATGAATLIAQQYKRTTGGYDIRHDILKSVMINTAIDKENIGPDYKVGFGMIDAKASVDVVKTIGSSSALVKTSKVSHNEQKVYNFTLSNNALFKTTVSWVDQPANPSNLVTLVNDIDMTLVNKTTGKTYYPYSLNKNNPNADAISTKPNRVDNVEQIEVANLPKGDYELIIKGYKIISDTQEFAIASNVVLSGESGIDTLRESKLKSFVKTIHDSIL